MSVKPRRVRDVALIEVIYKFFYIFNYYSTPDTHPHQKSFIRKIVFEVF